MKSDLSEVREVLRQLSQRPIAFHRAYVKITGSIHAGLFLSQACYWSDVKSDEDGWFWKTREQWHDETGLERDGQERARRDCARVGVLEEDLRGVPAKLFYRVNWDTIIQLLLSDGGPSTPNKEGVLGPKKLSKTSTITPNIKDSETITAETTAEIGGNYTFSEFKRIFSGRIGVAVPNRKDIQADFDKLLKDLGAAELRARQVAWIEATRDRYRDKKELKQWGLKNFFEEISDFELPDEAGAAAEGKDWRDDFPRL